MGHLAFLALIFLTPDTFPQKLPEATEEPSVGSITREFAAPPSEFAGPER
ncbi:MAG TPA: hypothetical protein VK818_09195 [Methylomirabilota bacterium]|jgi:hypothetical protein|nr:hypothetical protein [Methylomirabilota bacterium]